MMRRKGKGKGKNKSRDEHKDEHKDNKVAMSGAERRRALERRLEFRQAEIFKTLNNNNNSGKKESDAAAAARAEQARVEEQKRGFKFGGKKRRGAISFQERLRVRMQQVESERMRRRAKYIGIATALLFSLFAAVLIVRVQSSGHWLGSGSGVASVHRAVDSGRVVNNEHEIAFNALDDVERARVLAEHHLQVYGDDVVGDDEGNLAGGVGVVRIGGKRLGADDRWAVDGVRSANGAGGDAAAALASREQWRVDRNAPLPLAHHDELGDAERAKLRDELASDDTMERVAESVLRTPALRKIIGDVDAALFAGDDPDALLDESYALLVELIGAGMRHAPAHRKKAAIIVVMNEEVLAARRALRLPEDARFDDARERAYALSADESTATTHVVDDALADIDQRHQVLLKALRFKGMQSFLAMAIALDHLRDYLIEHEDRDAVLELVVGFYLRVHPASDRDQFYRNEIRRHLGRWRARIGELGHAPDMYEDDIWYRNQLQEMRQFDQQQQKKLKH
jgi:hypothetical protein